MPSTAFIVNGGNDVFNPKQQGIRRLAVVVKIRTALCNYGLESNQYKTRLRVHKGP